MSGSDRTVHRLRVMARDDAAARSLVPRLEDALRCASLPDAEHRVLLVRRLALGRVPPGATSALLQAQIERCLAQAGFEVLAAGAGDIEDAQAVSFASPWHARAALAVRLLSGSSCNAWYWQLAVPEVDRRLDAEANLLRIGQALATWPEAAVAVPAWLDQLAKAVATSEHAARLSTLTAGLLGPGRRADPVHARPAAALAERTSTGFRRPRHARASAEPEARSAAAKRAGADRPAPDAAPPPPAVESGPSRPASAGRVERQTAAGSARLTASTLRIEAVDPEARVPSRLESAGAFRPRSFSARSSAHDSPASGPLAPPILPRRLATASMPERARGSAIAAARAGLDESTDVSDCAGVLFLLQVLARLGLPSWLQPLPAEAAHAFTRALLRAAMQRARAPAVDCMWALLAPRDGGETHERPVPGSAPAAWRDALLRSGRGGQPLAALLEAACQRDEQLTLWLTATRRWLRRASGIGLASVLRRRARVNHSPTHIDLHFCVADADLRLRRSGLDIDPGWLPWFGAVVRFHYDAAEPIA